MKRVKKGPIAFVLTLALALPISTGAFAAKDETRIDVNTNITDIEQQAIQKEKREDRRGKSNKIYKDALETVDFGYSRLLVDKVMEFEKSHPTATEDEVNEYLLKIAKIYNRKNPENKILPENDDSRIGTKAVGEVIYEFIGDKANLNSQEQALFNSDPSRGLKAITAGKEAQDYTNYKFGFNGRGDKSDAYRHSAWNIWIVAFTGSVGWAKSWTDAHETGADPSENVPIEFNMDINNNTAGRQQAIYSNIVPGGSVNDTRSALDVSFKSGRLEYIPNYIPGGSGFTRVKFVGTNSDYVN